MLLKNFDSIDKGNKLINKTKNSNILVLYYAKWCGYCTQFKPEWQKIHTAITKSNICEVAEIESDELQYTKPLQSHFKGFPSLVLYTKKEITTPRNEGLMNMFMGKNYEPKLPNNAIKYDGDRTLDAIQAFLKQHIPQSSNSKDKATSKSKTTSRNYTQRRTMKGGMKKKGKTGKKTKNTKNTKKTTNNKYKKQSIKHIQKHKPSSSHNYNESTEYFTKQEIAKMKKERKKTAQIVSRLKRELNNTFKV